MNVDAGKSHSVHPAGIVLIVRPRVVGKNLSECLNLSQSLVRAEFSGKQTTKAFSHSIGIVNLEQRLILLNGIGKASDGIGNAIDIRQIRLDIVNWSTVHKVGTFDNKHGRIGTVKIY